MAEQVLNDIDEIRRMVNERANAEREANARPEAEEKGQDEPSKDAIPSSDILEALSRNQDGDALLYIRIHRGRFCYDKAASRWYVWNGHFWEKDTLNEATRAIDAVIEIYGHEARRQAWLRLSAEKAGKKEAGKHKDIEDALFKRIRSLQTVGRKENVLILACAGGESLAIEGNEWDRNPWLLACQNGVIDLHTGELRHGNPEDYLKTAAPVQYKGLETPAPTWEKFINEISGENSELSSYLQRLFGYGITGLTNNHIHPIFYGPQGRNGKTTLLEAVRPVLGELAYKARSETLLESRNTPARGSADADTLALRGKRIVWVSEVSEGRKLNASRIKELSGGDTLNARAPYGRDPVEFTPSHLLIMLTNERPHAPAGDEALWERIHLVPFHIRFMDNPVGPNEKKADHELLKKLKDEASGIFSWMVQGCLNWQREGLNPPEVVKGATREYRKEEDLIGQFISDRCQIGSVKEIQAGPLYKEYRNWAEEMGLNPTSAVRFGKEMKTRFECRQDRHKFYIGICLAGED